MLERRIYTRDGVAWPSSHPKPQGHPVGLLELGHHIRQHVGSLARDERSFATLLDNNERMSSRFEWLDNS